MRASRRRWLRSPAIATALLTTGLVGMVVSGGPAVADVTMVSGGATALSLGGSPTNTVSGSASQAAGQNGYGPFGSGFLPSGTTCPGSGVVPNLSLPLSTLLGIGLLDACTRGGDVLADNHLGFAESSTAAANVGLGGLVLGVVRSACRADGNGARGSTEIVGSGILGVPSSPAPNQVVPITGILPLGAILNLTLNEQQVSNTPGNASITVNAVHLNLLGIDIVIGQSKCQATGPDVNVTTTSSTAVSNTTPSSTAPTTTVAPGGGTNNNNNNSSSNSSNNTSNNNDTNVNPNTNTNPNTNGNTNPNTNSNSNPNTNTNGNTSNNTNTLTGGNNTNTNTVGGNNITINTPPAQIVILSQQPTTTVATQTQQQTQQQQQTQSQQQTQQQQQSQVLTGSLARTGASTQPIGAFSAFCIVAGLLLMIAGRRPLAAAVGLYGDGVPVTWGPVEIGKALVGGFMALVTSKSRRR